MKRSLTTVVALAATLTASAALAENSVATPDAMRAVRDQQTGKLRAPSQQELNEMLAQEKAARKARGEPEPQADAKPLEIKEHASGMRSARLGPEFLVTLEAQRDANGNLVVRHSDPADAHPGAPVTNELPTE